MAKVKRSSASRYILNLIKKNKNKAKKKITAKTLASAEKRILFLNVMRKHKLPKNKKSIPEAVIREIINDLFDHRKLIS